MKKNSNYLKKALPIALAMTAFMFEAATAQTVVQTFTYTGAVQNFTIPPCVGSMTIDARGAIGGTGGGGGSTGANGGATRGVITGTPGAVLYVYVGGQGTVTAGGFNGGGGGGTSSGTQGAGGGGASDIRLNGTALANRIMVAAGGGGGGGSSNYTPIAGVGGGGSAFTTGYGYGGAGAGGCASGSNGGDAGGTAPSYGSGGGGGGASSGGGGGGQPSASTGGYGCNGGLGVGGDGGGTSFICGGATGGVNGGGGGGGGYYGGGGGMTGTGGCNGGGGGGSSYINNILFTSPSFTSGVSAGNGTVTITYVFLATNVSASTTSASICNGNSTTLNGAGVTSYTWLPVGSFLGSNSQNITVNPSSTTAYTVTGTNSLGCVSQSILTVTVSSGLPVLSITTSTNSLCLGKTATVTASGALTYTWTNGITNGVSFLPTGGVNNYTVSGQNGCGITNAVATITVASLPVTVISTPTSVCAGSTATLNAASAVTGYTWQPGPLIGSSVVVGPIANTVYTVTASDGTCSGVGTVTLVAKPIPTLNIVSTASAVCVGAPVTMTASGALNYTWTTPANVTGAIITVNPSGPTLYAVTGDNSFGCTASANQVVLTNPSPTVNITSNKTIVCSGDAVNLLAGGSGASSYAWTGGPATTGYTVNPTSTTVYSVVGTGLGCTTMATINIAVINATVNVAITNPSICVGGTSTLVASGANTYSWTGFPNGPTAIVSPVATTVYTVNSVTTASAINCPFSKNVTITVYSLPTVSIASTKTVMCKADSGPKLTANGALTYTWNTNATTSTINVSPTVLNNSYTVTGTDANGCTNSAIILIQVNGCTGIAGVNAQSAFVSVYPNPSNGEFTVSGGSDMNLKIVNELGQEVSVIKLTSQNDHKVSVSNLASGIYFIVGQNENGKVNQKIIVSK